MKNPLIERYSIPLLRLPTFVTYALIYGTCLALILLLTSFHYLDYQTLPETKEVMRAIFVELFVIQMILCVLLMPFTTGMALIREIQSNSYDFFKMLPLRPGEVMTGIMVGTNLLNLGFSVINLCFLIFFGFLGKISFSVQFLLYFMLGAVSFFVNSVSLLSSINPDIRKKTAGHSPASAFVGVIFFAIFLIPVSIGIYDHLDQLSEISFYFLKIPLYSLTGFFALYLGIAALFGVKRKLIYERDSMVSPKGAFLFLLGIDFFYIGLIYPLAGGGELTSVYFYQILFYLFLFFVALASRNNLTRYFSTIRILKNEGLRDFRAFFYKTNLTHGFLLFLFFALSSYPWFLLSPDIRNLFPLLLCQFVLYSMTLLFFELHELIKKRYDKMGIMLIFLAVLYAILPIILGGMFNRRLIYGLSPLSGICVDITHPYYCWSPLVYFFHLSLLAYTFYKAVQELRDLYWKSSP